MRVFLLHAVVTNDVELAHTLGDFAVFHDAVDFSNDGRFARLASFEKLHHARQTAGDVFGLGGGSRNLRDHVAGVNFFAIRHHQVSVRRHQIALFFRAAAAFRADNDRRKALLIGRIGHHHLHVAGDFVHLLCVVTPSIKSLKWMVPVTSVKIENVYGSHSSRI